MARLYCSFSLLILLASLATALGVTDDDAYFKVGDVPKSNDGLNLKLGVLLSFNGGWQVKSTAPAVPLAVKQANELCQPNASIS